MLELVRRLKSSKFTGHTLTLKVKYADFSQITRSTTAGKPLHSKADILPLAKQLIAKVDFGPLHPIRLIGLGVGGAEPKAACGNTEHREWRELDLPFKE